MDGGAFDLRRRGSSSSWLGNVEDVPRLVEIGSGPHTTLDNLVCFVNLCRWHGPLQRSQQRRNVPVAVYSAEVLLDM